VSDADWHMLAPGLRLRTLRRSEYLLRAGEVERRIAFVLSGSFRWLYTDRRGEERNFHFFFEDSFVVGYDSYVTQMPSRLSIQAMQPASIVVLPPRDEILALYRRSHAWERFGRIVGEQVYADAAQRTQELLFCRAEERYLHLIRDHPDLLRRVSLAHIASFLGIKGPSLSRIRRRLASR
jgi:CRP-like cAMP-binding protein